MKKRYKHLSDLCTMLYYYFILLGCGFIFTVNTRVYGIKMPISIIQQNILKYPELPFNVLVNEIEQNKISDIYFDNTLKTVISERTFDDISDYSITHINPYIINHLVDLSVKNHVNTVFLEIPQTSFIQFFGNNIMPLLTWSFLLYIIISVVSSSFRRMPSLTDFIPENKDEIVKTNISLSSFAGSPEIFRECTEVVSYLTNATIYQNAGAEIPRGILLEGPPGTGKTLLAKAIASETNASFISVAASEFVELYVGMGAAKIRNLFNIARENKPCIIFIDEIDAVARQRGSGSMVNNNDERDQTLNQLLAEMDGFTSNDEILVIAATNRKDVLDAAILRPGRFDRIITVSLPDLVSRRAILAVHSKNKILAKDVNLGLISELTAGFSGAQIKNLLNEAAILTARSGKIVITEANILSALDKLIVGLMKETDSRSLEIQRRVAIHEAGHALIAALFPEYFNVKKVSIQSTYNGVGGYIIFNEHPDIIDGGLYTKNLLLKRLVISMGGKAAEYTYYGEQFVSAGAVQDLKYANGLAKEMVSNLGMGKGELEVWASSNKYYDSDRIKELSDNESLILVNQAYNIAKILLDEYRDSLDRIVSLLLQKRILNTEELKSCIDYRNGDIPDNLWD